MENILIYQPETETIRQMPQNYCIATKSKDYWMIDFDIAADEELVLRVTKDLFVFDNRYGSGLNLLSKITPNSEFNKTIKQLAKEHDFEYSHEYSDYIVESIDNGQRKQALELWNAMSFEDKTTCLEYYKNNYTKQGYFKMLEFIVSSQERL